MDQLTVLLVDDEAQFREVVAKRLRKRQINLFAAASGPEALRLMEEQAVDVVVLDVKMPEMEGTEVLQRIKQLDPTIEVIMLTGHADVETALKGMELGAFDYLLKPVNIDDLIYRLQDAYQRRSLRGQRGDQASGTALTDRKRS